MQTKLRSCTNKNQKAYRDVKTSEETQEKQSFTTNNNEEHARTYK